MKLQITLFLFFLFSCTNVIASQEYEENIIIQNSKYSYSENEKCTYISCLGELKNLSENTYEYITIQIQYFNSDGVIIDTVTEELYSHVLPPKEIISFRARDQADKNFEQYKSHKIKITHAEIKYIQDYDSGQSKKNWVLRILISWGPMLLLIFVWIFFIMRMNKNKNSPQVQSVAALKKQIELVEQQNKLFEKLIEAIERRK